MWKLRWSALNVEVALVTWRGVYQLFHPNGRPRPREPWFEFRLAGIGVPELEQGLFLWVPSIRFIVLPGFILDAVSVGLLRPAEVSGSGLDRFL